MRSLVVSLLVALAAGAQSPAPGPPTAMPGRQGSQSANQPGFNMTAQAAAHPEAVAAGEAVITIHGLCPGTGKTGDACATVLTKEQFEKIVAAVNQSGAPMPAVAIRNLA